jgi:hypothetical protein
VFDLSGFLQAIVAQPLCADPADYDFKGTRGIANLDIAPNEIQEDLEQGDFVL